MSDHTPVNLSAHVVYGRRAGPVMFVSAAIHDDEIIGVKIVRRLLRAPSLDRLKGTLLAVPIVNALGFMTHSRYLPDRRDLNRSFLGSAEGSLASRLAEQTFGTNYAANISTWSDIAALEGFMDCQPSAAAIAMRDNWFTPLDEPTFVLWWVPSDHRPGFAEACAKLDALKTRGPNPAAFTFERTFPPPS